jgi:hypothetical protein
VGFSWVIRCERQIGTLPDGARCVEKASEQLRREKHIDGVEALARKLMPGLKLDSRVSPELQIVAPLPFDLNDTREGGVRLAIPSTAQRRLVTLKAFFYPDSLPHAERVVGSMEYPDQDGTLCIEWKPEWPETATHAAVHLFWGEHNVDALRVNRWNASASILGALDEYFDSDHALLRAALKWNPGKKSDDFELAVVRLLNVLGISAIWYGKTVDPDRADAACVVHADHSTVLLLIECVRNKPDEKFSALAERSRHLKNDLQIAAEVIPVVFTAARAIEPEITAAGQYGVGLIGADEIEQLLELIGTPNTTVNTVLQRLRPRQTIADFVLGTAGRLTSLG